MATFEDRQHNERLIYNYTRRLKILEDRRSKQGDNTDPAVDIEIEELQLNIATLEELLSPDISPEVQAATRRAEGDWSMLFVQFVKYGQRLTKVEERAQLVAEQQIRDSHWRLNVTDMIEQVATTVRTNDHKRQAGQQRNLIVQIVIVALIVLDTVAIIALMLALRGP